MKVQRASKSAGRACLLGLSCVLFAANLGGGCPVPGGDPASTWARSYGGPYGDEADAVQATVDGGYIAVGVSGDARGPDGNVWALKLDATGTVEFSRTYGNSGLSLQNAFAAPTDDGGAIVFGKKQSSLYRGGDQAYVVKLDPGGVVQWQTLHTLGPPPESDYPADEFSYRVPNTRDGFTIVQLHSGGYVFAGVVYRPFPRDDFAGWTELWVVLIGLDGNGQELWRRYLTDPEWDRYDGSAGLASTTGGFALALGLTRVEPYSTGSFEEESLRAVPFARCWSLQANGAPIWDRELGDWRNVAAILETDDGGLVVAGAVGDDYDFNLTKLDGDDGEIVWSQNYLHGGSLHGAVAQFSPEHLVTANTSESTAGVALRRASDSLLQSSFVLQGILGDSPSAQHARSITPVDTDADGINDAVTVFGFEGKHGEGWMEQVAIQSAANDWQLSRNFMVELNLAYPSFRGFNSAALVGGGYVLAGQRLGARQGWVEKRNEDGSVAWTLPPTDMSDGAAAVRQTRDRGYVIAGHTASFADEGKDVWLLRLAENGNLRWQQRYGGAGDEEARDVVETPDGGFLLVGSTNSMGAGGSDAWIIKVDAGGRVQWQKTCGTAENDVANATCVSGGDYFVGGETTRTENVGSSEREIDPTSWLRRFDVNGNLRWQFNHVSSGIVDMMPSDGGRCVIATDAGAVGEIDASGDVLWWSSATRVRGRAITRFDNGDIGVAGWSSHPPALLAARLTPIGEEIWTRKYDMGGDESARSVCPTPDGGLLLAGRTNSISGAFHADDAWIVKVNADGYVSSGCPDTIGELISGGWEGPEQPIEKASVVAEIQSYAPGPDTWSTDATTSPTIEFYDELVVTRQCFGLDSDSDGVSDENDRCPDTPLGASVDEFGCSCAAFDSDGDGVDDCDDLCPDDANKIDAGNCGCGTPETADCGPCPDGDDDGDGVCNADDICPGQNDNLNGDGDGVPDCMDGCPMDPLKTVPGECGCGTPDTDANGNGVPDCQEAGLVLVVVQVTLQGTGLPVIGALVSVYDEGPPTTLVCSGNTDANGEYECNQALPVGTPLFINVQLDVLYGFTNVTVSPDSSDASVMTVVIQVD